ncbi:MAG TPA: NrsF family protein [Anaeromyxobacter sp.]|nr:NrsF family protein [Anaeromyxobacter sp.]
MTHLESLKLRVLQAVAERPVPPRSGRLPSTVLLVVLSATVMFAVIEWVPRLFGGVGGLAHAVGRPASIEVGLVMGIVVLALVSTWISSFLRRSMLSPPRGLLLCVAIGVPLCVGAWITLWHGSYSDPFVPGGLRCFELTLLTAPWPFVTLVYASRRFEPRHPGTVGAAFGAVAGAWAAVMVELWCPVAEPKHVLVGHVLPLLVLVVAGSAIGRRLLRLRRM